MAPEILLKEPYQGHVVDLFALGIILFILYAGHPPFNMAHPNDSHYKLIATNRADLFWKYHSNRKPAGFFSDSFKDLITNMLQTTANQRLGMADIIGHPWMQGQFASSADIQQEFANREASIKITKEAEQAEKAAKRQDNNQSRVGVRRGVNADGKCYMSDGQDLEESKTDSEIVCLKLDTY